MPSRFFDRRRNDDERKIQKELARLESVVETLLLHPPVQGDETNDVALAKNSLRNDLHFHVGQKSSKRSFYLRTGLRKSLEWKRKTNTVPQKGGKTIEKNKKLLAICQASEKDDDLSTLDENDFISVVVDGDDDDESETTSIRKYQNVATLEAATFDIEAFLETSKSELGSVVLCDDDGEDDEESSIEQDEWKVQEPRDDAIILSRDSRNKLMKSFFSSWLEKADRTSEPRFPAENNGAEVADITLKSVEASREILSSSSFQAWMADSVGVKYNDRPNGSPPPFSQNQGYLKKRIQAIYNVFRTQQEKRTRLKYMVFSWLLKNGTTTFYANPLTGKCESKRKQTKVNMGANKKLSLTEQEILDAGLDVIRNRFEQICRSFKIRNNNRQMLLFKEMLLSWLQRQGGLKFDSSICLLPPLIERTEAERTEGRLIVVRTGSASKGTNKNVVEHRKESSIESVNDKSALKVTWSSQEHFESKGSNEVINAAEKQTHLPALTLTKNDSDEEYNGIYDTCAQLCGSYQFNHDIETSNNEDVSRDEPGLLLVDEKLVTKDASKGEVSSNQQSILSGLAQNDDKGDMELVTALVQLWSASRGEDFKHDKPTSKNLSENDNIATLAHQDVTAEPYREPNSMSASSKSPKGLENHLQEAQKSKQVSDISSEMAKKDKSPKVETTSASEPSFFESFFRFWIASSEPSSESTSINILDLIEDDQPNVNVIHVDVKPANSHVKMNVAGNDTSMPMKEDIASYLSPGEENNEPKNIMSTKDSIAEGLSTTTKQVTQPSMKSNDDTSFVSSDPIAPNETHRGMPLSTDKYGMELGEGQAEKFEHQSKDQKKINAKLATKRKKLSKKNKTAQRIRSKIRYLLAPIYEHPEDVERAASEGSTKQEEHLSRDDDVKEKAQNLGPMLAKNEQERQLEKSANRHQLSVTTQALANKLKLKESDTKTHPQPEEQSERTQNSMETPSRSSSSESGHSLSFEESSLHDTYSSDGQADSSTADSDHDKGGDDDEDSDDDNGTETSSTESGTFDGNSSSDSVELTQYSSETASSSISENLSINSCNSNDEDEKEGAQASSFSSTWVCTDRNRKVISVCEEITFTDSICSDEETDSDEDADALDEEDEQAAEEAEGGGEEEISIEPPTVVSGDSDMEFIKKENRRHDDNGFFLSSHHALGRRTLSQKPKNSKHWAGYLAQREDENFKKLEEAREEEATEILTSAPTVNKLKNSPTKKKGWSFLARKSSHQQQKQIEGGGIPLSNDQIDCRDDESKESSRE